MPNELKGGRYELERELGRGGMGVVYRARDTKLKRIVALKMVPAEFTRESELRRRLATEARAACTISHPGVATVFDFEEHASESFIVYEYVEGATMREKLRSARFVTEDVLDIGTQLADALASAHERGIVHRDLKPENIMLTPGPERTGRIRILDFGLAKLRPALSQAKSAGGEGGETAPLSTAPGLIVGTVNYMSPEQLEGESVDHRTDLYSLGLVLYEIATGANPFVGKSPTSTIANILKLEAPPIAARNPVAPAELDRILRKCLRKRPEERYQSARELFVDLSNLRRELVIPSGSTPAVPTTEAPSVLPFSRGFARVFLLLIQAGYMAMYGAALYYLLEGSGFALRIKTGNPIATVAILCALCGLPVRLYLLTAVAADYFDLGRKFRWLSPAVLVLDLVWAASPLLILQKAGGLTLVCIVGLAYLPFVQRVLVFSAYAPTGGRISGAKPPDYL